MEELQAKHRKEAKDLQSRMTQKKKAATKKTRKGVNDECDNLEREMKQRHATEIAALDSPGEDQQEEEVVETRQETHQVETQQETRQEIQQDGATNGIADLGLSDNQDEQPPQDAQPTSSAPPDPPVAAPAPKKQNRAKARLARRAAEQEALISSANDEASNLPDLKAAERERMLSQFTTLNLSEKEIRADGHCLYSAFADQLQQLNMPLNTSPSSTPDIKGTLEPYKIIRAAAADYIETHPDDFAPFLEEPLAYYVHKVRNTGEWGGQLELMALAKGYGVGISVLQGDGRVEEIKPEDGGDGKEVWLAYYRHGFGLGEHYNSLRKAA